MRLSVTVLRFIGTATAMAVGATPGMAEPLRSFCPKGGGLVPKDNLAAFILDKANLPRRLEIEVREARSKFAGLDGLTEREILVAVGPDACGKITCTPDERTALNATRILYDGVRRNHELRMSEPRPAAERFFAQPEFTLVCPAQTTASADESAAARSGTGDAAVNVATPTARRGPVSHWGPDPLSLEDVRVRGSSDDLIYDRGESGYASAGKAKVSYSDDKAAGKKSTQYLIAVGYPVGIYRGGNEDLTQYMRVRLIPYAAVNLDSSRKTGAARNISNDQIELGGAIEVLHSSLGSDEHHHDHYLGIFPKYLIDYKDHSAIAGLDVIYRPYLGPGINNLTALGSSRVDWNIIVDVRFDNGHFTRIGTRDPTASKDFSRLGGEIGLGLSSSKGFPIPFDATVSEIYLPALAGSPGHLSLLKTDLGVYFSEEKTFGIDIAYSRGRARDLDDTEHKVTFGLTLKY